MDIFGRLTKTYRSYPTIYWVVITLEFMERGAYYGIMGYFSVHLVNNLGFSGTQYGILYALLVGLLYIVPLVAAALAKKIGYRTMLMVAFTILIPSYFLMMFVKSYIAFFPLIFAWGIGAGAFKPLVSATIAHVTDDSQRNSSFSIYYLSINWGSLVAMLFIGLLIPEHFAQIAFGIGAVLITVNLIITFIFYRDPIEKDPTEKLTTAFNNLLKVLPDTKFMVLLLLYSGFFFIFSSMHTYLPLYYTNFGLKPAAWVTAPVMTAINPFTIVALGPFLSPFMDKHDSLKLMIFGMITFCFGLLLLGMIPLWYALAMGIFIFSIGEFLTHPNFISYTSKIAPKEKLALYMGFAFIPSAIGNITGSLFGGILWDKIAVDMQRPGLFWGIFIGIGLFTIANFLIYNMWISQVVQTVDVKRRRGIWTSKITPFAVYASIILVILTGVNVGTSQYTIPGDSGTIHNVHYTTTLYEESISEGYLRESEEIVLIEDVEIENVQYVNITLIWRDESDIRRAFRTYRNDPDTFTVSVSMDNMTTITKSSSNSHGQEGVIAISHRFQSDPPHLDGTGRYTISVKLDEAGNYSPGIGIIGFEDEGNAYTLIMAVTHRQGSVV